MLTFWLALLFGTFCLTSPPNPNGRDGGRAYARCRSRSIVFVILDMDEPYGGLFGVPSTSMRNALADMMR